MAARLKASAEAHALAAIQQEQQARAAALERAKEEARRAAAEQVETVFCVANVLIMLIMCC